MKLLILFLMTLFSKTEIFAQNGYRLEFEDVVTLSVDSINAFSTPNTRTKSYTVPLGTVLKITSGHLSMGGLSSNTRFTIGYLKISDQTIVGSDSVVSFLATYTPNTYWRTTYKITPESPIWAPSGAVVILGVQQDNSATNPNATCGCSNWISGVLFRKVPN